MKNQNSLSTRRILWKALCLGLRVKTPVSLFVSILAIPAALIPLLLSRQLQHMTDLMVSMAAENGAVLADVVSAFLLLGVYFLLQLFFQFLSEYHALNDKYRTKLYIKEYVLRQVCTVHYSYLENRDDFFKRIEFADSYAADEMSRNVQTIFVVLQQIVLFVSISIALWAVHPAIVLILLITSIPAAILSYKQADETFRNRTKWCEEGALAIHFFHKCTSTDRGIQEVRHYELFDYLKARWRALADSYIFKKNQLTAKHLKANLLADFLRSAVYLVILLLTAWMIYQNPAIGIGVFTLVYTLSDKMQKATGTILTSIMQFSASLSYMKEFFSLEELEREETEESLIEDSEQGGSIAFENVSFSYPNSDKEVLHDISVSIRGGEKIAIVGDNGSGKSTFISLLTGMFPPDSGQVYVDHLPMSGYKQSLRKRISVIFQDFAHYEASLRENITVSDTSQKLSDETIMELARKIHVEDVIEEQANGLNSLLGHLSSKGNDLSGGQWQKIALLRAVYRSNTGIMILDEPTAALDPLAEAELYRNFAQITGDRTTLLISHRLGITKLVDRILVFRDGRIIEDGTHQELMEQKGYYSEMYQAQAAWYKTE
ncbi:MAG: ABC transporter ATP-binding protein [Oscillospiraceae bacterium]|nr:ABC transporter ATP-binding protein [Oscillospiraceae bacterium]